MNRQQFVNVVSPVAVKVRIDGGVLFPSVSLAQTILETGGNIPSWNNIVGYKVGSGRRTDYWNGRSVSTRTWEVYDGVRHDNVTANWRAYDSIEFCLKDQALLFIHNARYARVIRSKTPVEQAAMLKECGYATDPAYADKIAAIIRSERFERYDQEADAGMEALRDMQRQLDELKALMQEQPAPEWAAPTVEKLVQMKLLNDPNGDRSFHRMLVVLDRAGVFETQERG